MMNKTDEKIIAENFAVGSKKGTLVRSESGPYSIILADGQRISVDGRKIAAMLGTIGRPKSQPDSKIRSVRLANEDFDFAREIGAGNVSDGIRTALQKYRKEMNKPG